VVNPYNQTGTKEDRNIPTPGQQEVLGDPRDNNIYR
jgi:hypothetical protein